MLETSPNDPEFKHGYDKLSKYVRDRERSLANRLISALNRNLKQIAERLCPIQGSGAKRTLKDGCWRFLKATGDADIVQDCITTVDKTLSDYQVCFYVACM